MSNKTPLLPFLLLLFVFPVSLGCKTAHHKQLKNITKVEVTLFGFTKQKLNRSYKTVTYTKAADIKKLIGFLSTTKSPLYKCGYFGKITFHTKAKNSLSYEYNLSDACRHGVYLHGGSLHSFKLSKAGASFLIKLYAKLPKKEMLPGVQKILKKK